MRFRVNRIIGDRISEIGLGSRLYTGNPAVQKKE